MKAPQKKMTTATIEHAGVMAALRRAFQAAANEPSDRDFAELLRKLN
jgi:hypothetical protein